MKQHKAKRSFTLIELVISVALLLVAISIALFAVVGTNGMIQKADARSSISESTRSVGETIRRAVSNSPVGGVSLLSDTGTVVAIQVKAFSDLQSGNTCTIIGRANASTGDSGEEEYTIAKGGATIAVLIYNVDEGGLCPQLSTDPIYQNRLTNTQAVVKDAQFTLQNIPCTPVTPTCITKQLLRYSLTLEMAQKGSGGTSEARRPTLTIQEGLSIGLVNEAVTSLKIDTVSLPNAFAGDPYTAGVVASGGMPAYSWSKIAGSWPPGGPGFAIDSVTGVITGTPNSQAAGNTYNFTIQVTDSDNPASVTTRVLSLFVVDDQIAITPPYTLPNATVGSNYTPVQQLRATRGVNPFMSCSCTWSIDSGGLPLGMSMSSGGVVSGRPEPGTAGTYNPVIRAAESSNLSNYATQTFSLTVLSDGQTIVITTASLPNGAVNQFYNGSPAGFQLIATGAAGYVWSITSGSLPPGLQLNSSTGYIYGTPTCPAGQSPPFTVRATDSGNPLKFGTKDFTITITDQFSSCGFGQE